MNIEVVKLAEELCRQAVYGGNVKVIQPKPGSIIGVLKQALGNLDLTGSNEEIVEQATGISSTFGHYKGYEEQYAKELAKSIARIEDAARNHVNPLAKEIIGLIEKARETARLQRHQIAVKVVPVELHPVFSSSIVSELTKNYTVINSQQTQRLNEVLRFVANKLTPDERGELVKTGTSIDAALLDYLGDTELLFAQFEYEADSTIYNILSPKQSLYFFFLLLGIQNQRVDLLSALLDDYEIKADLATAISKAGSRIQSILSSYARAQALGAVLIYDESVVDAYKPFSKKDAVYVIKRNYQKWCETQGGSAEAVLGLNASTVASIQTLASDATLKQDVERYTTFYNQKLKAAEMVDILDEQKIVRSITLNRMTDYINRLETPMKADLHKRLKDSMEHEFHGTGDLVPYLIKVVARTLFPSAGDPSDKTQSDVKNYCLEVHSLMNSDPDLDISAIQRLVRIRLLAKVFARQLDVVRTK